MSLTSSFPTSAGKCIDALRKRGRTLPISQRRRGGKVKYLRNYAKRKTTLLFDLKRVFLFPLICAAAPKIIPLNITTEPMEDNNIYIAAY